MNVDILRRLAVSKSGLGIRDLASRLGWDDLPSLNKQLISMQTEGYLRIENNRKWILTPSGHDRVNAEQTRNPVDSPVTHSASIVSRLPPEKKKSAKEVPGLDTIPVQARRLPDVPVTPQKQDEHRTIPVGALLAYYRACLAIEDRSDPQADWEDAGKRFTPIRLTGPWWPSDGRPAMLTVARAMLPEGFQQALGRTKGDGTLHLGYPLEVTPLKSGGTMIRAVSSVPLRWQATRGDVIAFETLETGFTLNPGWVSFHRKHVDFKGLADRIGESFAPDNVDDEDVDPPSTLQTDLKELCLLLNMAFASKRNGELTPETTDAKLPHSKGIHNVAALFVTSGAKYSAASIRDLEALSKSPTSQFHSTALGTLLGLPSPSDSPSIAVLEPVTLTYSQLSAVRSGLSEPLTVITGPPGTGKSQVVTAFMASAAAQGKTVLFASRNHAALDAVEPRLSELSPNRPLMVRFNRRWGEASTSVRITDLIRAIVSRPVDSSGGSTATHQVASLAELDKERSKIMARAADLALLRDAVAAREGELAQLCLAMNINAAVAMTLPPPTQLMSNRSSSLLERVIKSLPAPVRQLLARMFHKPAWTSAGCPPLQALKEYEEWLGRLGRVHTLIPEIHHLASGLPAEDVQADLGKHLEKLTGDISTSATRLMPVVAKNLDWVTEDQRQTLMEIRGTVGHNRLSGSDVRRVLQHYPLWAMSNLTVAKHIPPEPLFDYVVIDEASQCDIASALPLLARAHRAIIVGDPAQLGCVSKLSPEWELETLQALGLSGSPGIGRFRQSRNSLFDLASTVRRASRHLLTDHFRCHSDIASYVETFYGSQLSVLTDTRQLNPPPGQRPGLYWDHVDGPIVDAARGCHSPSEATAIIEALKVLLIDQGYSGTVGVCTPFREQANRLSDKIAETFTPELVAERRLVAQTANGFQGDARDVIFISLCLGPGIPAGSLGFVREGANLFNVAVSRARAVCRVIGNRQFALQSEIPHIRRLINTCDRQSRPTNEELLFESPWEEKLYQALVEAGIRCTPQYPIAGRRLDLAWFSEGGQRLDIEVDGDRYHRDPSGLRKIDDVWRDHQLRGLGWKVLRFWVYELREDMNGCVERVRRAIAQ